MDLRSRPSCQCRTSISRLPTETFAFSYSTTLGPFLTLLQIRLVFRSYSSFLMLSLESKSNCDPNLEEVSLRYNVTLGDRSFLSMLSVMFSGVRWYKSTSKSIRLCNHLSQAKKVSCTSSFTPGQHKHCAHSGTGLYSTQIHRAFSQPTV